jgi:hypothetical protein
MVRMPPASLARLDAWIADQPEPKPSRPEAARRLIEMALAAQIHAKASAVESSKWKYGADDAGDR